jgi:hypothetical protein
MPTKWKSCRGSRPAVAVVTAGAAGTLGYLFIGPGSTDGFTRVRPKAGPSRGPQIVDEQGERV